MTPEALREIFECLDVEAPPPQRIAHLDLGQVTRWNVHTKRYCEVPTVKLVRAGRQQTCKPACCSRPPSRRVEPGRLPPGSRLRRILPVSGNRSPGTSRRAAPRPATRS